MILIKLLLAILDSTQLKSQGQKHIQEDSMGFLPKSEKSLKTQQAWDLQLECDPKTILCIAKI